ncbi:MAG: hypothetical protein E6Q97_22555 [Desulfurellales bacterium]|nr:MAG: hypothetical protein E6Q97_22555 [Desulfurellales bacterium]
MGAINWLRVLNSAGVEYIERGANVKRGEINIRCPFCGAADPSHHMGLNLTNGWWACWRNQSHRGKSPLRLLVRLLGCSYARACELAGITPDYVDPDGFDAVAARVMQRDGLQRVEEVRRDFLTFPPKEVTPITGRGQTRRHWDYLVQVRGFRPSDIQHLTLSYGILAGVGDYWRDRVMFPYLVNEELVAWTGRAIAESNIRYKDLAVAECLIPPKQTLYNHDAALAGGEVLLVVEGPMDALKLDCYGAEWGVRAVGLSTNSISDQQIFLLEEAAPRFRRTLVMMDNSGQLSIVDSIRMKERMAQIRNLGFVPVPFGKKDGGDLAPSQVVMFARSLT